jgi:hypothetical protein
LAFEITKWNSKADKIIKLKCQICCKSVANAWATFKAWSKCGVNARSNVMRMHRQHYQTQMRVSVSIIICKAYYGQMRMNGQLIAANPAVLTLASQSAGWADYRSYTVGKTSEWQKRTSRQPLNKQKL